MDQLELDSIADIPWGAFGTGIALSAAIGAAGGMVYTGLRGPRDE